MTYTQKIVNFILDTKYEDIPEAAIEISLFHGRYFYMVYKENHEVQDGCGLDKCRQIFP